MKANRNRYLLVFLLSGILVLEAFDAQMAHASGALALQEGHNEVELGLHSEYLEDPEGQLILQEVRSKAFEPRWKPIPKSTPNFGYSSSSFWLKTSLQETTTQSSRILQIAYPILDNLQFFLFRNGQLEKEIQTGDYFPFKERPVWNRNFLLPFEMQNGDTVDIYLRVQTSTSVQIPMVLWQQESFARSEQTSLAGQCIFYGIILAMLLFNFFLFVSTRELNYLSYVFYVGLTGLFFSTLQGFSFQYLWPNDVAWNDLSICFLCSSLMIFLAIFTIDFLELGKTLPKAKRVLICLGTGSFAGVILSVSTPYSIAIPFIIVCSLATLLSCLLIGSILTTRGDKTARIFTAAFAVFSFGGILFVLNKLGVLPHNFATENGMGIGFGLQITLLSIALGARIQTLKDESTKAQMDAANAQTQLIQSAKLATLGQMISSIGHEIANPINYLNMAVDSIGEKLEEFKIVIIALFDSSPEAQNVSGQLNDKLDKMLSQIGDQETAIKRLVDISTALRTQARNDQQECCMININEVIRESMVIVSGKTKLFEIDEKLGEVPVITGHRSQIGQVVTNILANAADALHEKRTAKSEQGEQFLGKITISSSTLQNENTTEAFIVVRDNGNGVPQEIKDKIFEAFFTTKEAGKGTGLGLSMSADIIQDHRGRLIVLDDEDLGGARFEIRIPESEQ